MMYCVKWPWNSGIKGLYSGLYLTEGVVQTPWLPVLVNIPLKPPLLVSIVSRQRGDGVIKQKRGIHDNMVVFDSTWKKLGAKHLWCYSLLTNLDTLTNEGRPLVAYH